MRARADVILDEHEFLKGQPADFGFKPAFPVFSSNNGQKNRIKILLNEDLA
jgi:hypothetical protein